MSRIDLASMAIWDVTKKLLPYVKKNKWRVLGSVLLSFVLAGIQGLQVRLIKPIFDHGLKGGDGLEEAIKLAAILLGLGVLHFPARFFHFYWIRYAVDRAVGLIRRDIYEKMQKLPSSFYTANKQGTLVSHMAYDAQKYAEGIRGVVDLIREPLKAVAMFTLAVMADWQLTLAIVVSTPLFVLIFQRCGKSIQRHQGVVQKEVAELTHFVGEEVSGHKITKAFNLQEYGMSRFEKAQKKVFRALMRVSFIEEISHPLVEFVGVLTFSAVVVFAQYRISSGAITSGNFVSFVAALALLMEPIRKFSQANVMLNQAQAAGTRLYRLFFLPEERDRERGHRQAVAIKFCDKIQCQNLSFSYVSKEENNVLSNLSLTVKKGQKVAIVGLSGSGKSTLINLFLGLYPVDYGTITIDGVPIDQYSRASLRNLLGYVGQDVFLFHDTVRENLTLGQSFPPDNIQEALEVAHATAFVDKLPGGLDTIIGDRGTKLSGGQQQRLTIARAYLRDPQILLFDEATSALDNKSELLVQKALESVASQKTVIAVAHRLSTIQNYDRIYVLSEGHLVEEGTHDELVKRRGGEYAKLYELGQRT